MEYYRAIQYLRTSSRAKEIIYELETSPRIFTIQFVDNDDDSYLFHTKTIYWDPDSGLITESGNTQSAALGLIHEMGHAEQDLQGKFNKTVQEIEDENLNKTENVVAQELCEAKRKNYFDFKGTITMKNSVDFYNKDYEIQKKYLYYYDLYGPKK